MGCLLSPLSWFLSWSLQYLLSYFLPYFVDENAEWDRPAKRIAGSDQDDSTVARVDNLTVEVPEDTAEPDQDDSSLVRLDRLPAGILQIIAEFLTSGSEACFILSRKSFGLVIGHRSWLTLRSKIQKHARLLFLIRLEKDLEEWVLCYHCERLHPAKRNPLAYTEWLGADERPCSQADGAIELLPNFVLRWQHAHMIMKLNKLSPENNIWLHALSRTVFRGQVPFAHCCARIAKEILMVKLEYRILLRRHEGLREVEKSFTEVCPHWTFCGGGHHLKEIIRFHLALGPDDARTKCTRIQCHRCATEFVIVYLTSTWTHDGRALYITAWKDLGPCQTPFGIRWRAQILPIPFAIHNSTEKSIVNRNSMESGNEEIRNPRNTDNRPESVPHPKVLESKTIFSFTPNSIRVAFEDTGSPNKSRGIASMSPLYSDIEFSKCIDEPL